ncbi:MAG: YggS family pyridoxal phosphate-dependent enzyme [Candidatus Flexifilum sp.]|jgi:pyridoxal phosphate enzyme (YggS family)
MNPAEFTARLHRVRDQIRAACQKAGRSPDEVTLVAVSKTHPADAVVTAIEAGLQHFGENRVEEAAGKIPQMRQLTDRPVIWHMIGHVQSRKARDLPGLFALVHSIDTIRLADKLSRALAEAGQTMDVLLEMNVSGEASKAGFAAHNWRNNETIRAQLAESLDAVARLPNIRVRGLMTMAPIAEDPETVRWVFADLRELRDWLARSTGIALPELSMGMTDDFPVAIEEGATLIRIGRALFGERGPQPGSEPGSENEAKR